MRETARIVLKNEAMPYDSAKTIMLAEYNDPRNEHFVSVNGGGSMCKVIEINILSQENIFDDDIILFVHQLDSNLREKLRYTSYDKNIIVIKGQNFYTIEGKNKGARINIADSDVNRYIEAVNGERWKINLKMANTGYSLYYPRGKYNVVGGRDTLRPDKISF